VPFFYEGEARGKRRKVILITESSESPEERRGLQSNNFRTLLYTSYTSVYTSGQFRAPSYRSITMAKTAETERQLLLDFLVLALEKGGVFTLSREDFNYIWERLLLPRFRNFFRQRTFGSFLNMASTLAAKMGIDGEEFRRFASDSNERCSLTPTGIIMAVQKHFGWRSPDVLTEKPMGGDEDKYTLNVPLLFALLRKMTEEEDRWAVSQGAHTAQTDVKSNKLISARR
jgi:hypothetical protein